MHGMHVKTDEDFSRSAFLALLVRVSRTITRHLFPDATSWQVDGELGILQ